VALSAIFSCPEADSDGDEPFKLDDDGQGFILKVVPHPGDAEANFVWAHLSIRCPSLVTQVCFLAGPVDCFVCLDNGHCLLRG
jgi:hypothetical protein